MEKIVLDANIFIKLLIEEHDSKQALELISFLTDENKEISILAPDVVINETMNVIERCRLDKQIAYELFKGLMSLNMELKLITPYLLDSANHITQHGNSRSGYPTFSDSLYHAIALQEECLFITADNKHLAKTQKEFGHISLLKNWQDQLS